MSLLTKIIIGIIALHLIAGFGWLMYQLSPQKGDQLINNSEIQDDDAN